MTAKADIGEGSSRALACDFPAPSLKIGVSCPGQPQQDAPDGIAFAHSE
jgi:hypothetical protein